MSARSLRYCGILPFSSPFCSANSASSATSVQAFLFASASLFADDSPPRPSLLFPFFLYLKLKTYHLELLSDRCLPRPGRGVTVPLFFSASLDTPPSPLRYFPPCSPRPFSTTSNPHATPAYSPTPPPKSKSAIPSVATFSNSLPSSKTAASPPCVSSAAAAPPPSPAPPC